MFTIECRTADNIWWRNSIFLNMWYLLGDPRWTTYLLFFQFIISIHDGWNVISFLPRLFYFNFNFFSWTTNPIKITDRIQFQFTQWQDNTRDLQSITCGTSNITDHTHFIHSFSIHALIINFMHIIICLYTTIAMPWNIVHLTLFGKKITYSEKKANWITNRSWVHNIIQIP